MSAAPDLVVPVAGFRSWRLANGRLLSPYVPCRWEGRVLHARCFDANRSLVRGQGWLDVPHASPHPDCQCGIYAHHRPGLRGYYGELSWCEGVVTGWGRLVVHADGWRAEHARVEALAWPSEGERRLRDVVARIAAALGVDVVEREALPSIAQAAGRPVPDVLRPAPA